MVPDKPGVQNDGDGHRARHAVRRSIGDSLDSRADGVESRGLS
jgi:hypothetical protein